MPRYAYRCSEDHVTEQFFRIRERAKQIRCGTAGCKKTAKRSIGDESGNVIGDIPAHFNVSLGRHVESRAHLKKLQAKLGVRDYEKQRNEGPSTSWR